MFAHYGTDTEQRTFTMPAPWGGIVLTQAFDSLWQIDVQTDPVSTAESAPPCIACWTDCLTQWLEDGLELSPEQLDALLSSPRGSELSAFARRVLIETARIRPGQWQSYGQVAAACGNPKAARAVAHVLASNPFLILIPCHRVVRAAALGRFDVLQPQTAIAGPYRGQAELAPIGAWLRLHDMSYAT